MKHTFTSHTNFKIHFDILFPFNLHDIVMGIVNVVIASAKANAKRYRDSINAAFQLVLRFSFKRKRGEELPCGGRSKWKGDKQVKTKNTYPGMVEKKGKIGECLFSVDVGSFIPSSYSFPVGSSRLHSPHCLRSTAKGFPNTPPPGRRLLVYSSNVSPPPSSRSQDENRLMLERDPRRSRATWRGS